MDHPYIRRAMLTGYTHPPRKPTQEELDEWAEEKDWLRTNLSTYIENCLDDGREPDLYDFMDEYGYSIEAEWEIEREFDRMMKIFERDRNGRKKTLGAETRIRFVS